MKKYPHLEKKLFWTIVCAGVFCAPVVCAQPAAPAKMADEAAAAPKGGEAASSAGALRANLLPPDRFSPKPIVIEKEVEPLEERFNRMITLDVRDMNVLDVMKFLSVKGEFNMVTASKIGGRLTLNLKNVRIGDALDIIAISNGLAYHVESDIVQIMTEQEYGALLGKKFNDKNIIEIVHLNYAKPSYVLATMDQLKSQLGRIIIDEDTGTVVMIDTPESVARMKNTLLSMESPLEPFIYSLQYGKASEVADKLRGRLDAHAVGSITVDERNNKLIIRAIPGRREEVEKLIISLDAPTKEVLIECRVLQVTFRPQMDYGIDWNLDFRDSPYRMLRRTEFNNIYMNESALASTLSPTLATNYAKLTFGDFDYNKFDLAIRSLKQVSDTKILSNPKILVTNNEEASIHVGDTVPYIISTTSGSGENAVTSEDVRFVDVGLKLNVTPTINDDGFVTMILNPEISTVATRISSQGGGIPQVNKTSIQTTVMVKDGMTIVLGGLKKENKTQSRKGFPFLMDMPILKYIFGTQSDSIEATEIVIFITPHLVTGDEQDYEQYRGTVKPAQEYGLEDKEKEKISQKQSLSIKR